MKGSGCHSGVAWCCHVRLALIAALLFNARILRAQTVQEDLSADTPAAFDSFNPERYSQDYPWLPETDPMSGLPQNNPDPMPSLLDPDLPIRWQEAAARDASPTPGDYDPQIGYQTSTLQNIEGNQPLVGYPASDYAGTVLLGRRYPAFHLISKVVKDEAMPLSLVLPAIPAPLVEFGIKPARRLKLGPLRIALDVTTAVAYNNNVFGTSSNPKGDRIFGLLSNFTLEAGTRGLVRINYATQLSRYATYKDQNSFNENLQFSLRYPFSKLELGVESFYQSVQGLFINSDGPAEQKSLLTSFSANYPVTSKLSSSVSLQNGLLSSNPGGFKVENTVSLTVFNQLFGTASGGVFLQAGAVDAPVGQQNFFSAQLAGGFRTSYHFEFRGQAGMQVRRFSPDVGGMPQLVTPIFDFTTGYYPTHNFSLLLRLYRKLSSDTFANISLDIQTGAEISLLAQFFQRFDLKIRVGVGYIEGLSDTAATQEYNFLQGGMILSYTIYRMFDVSIFSNIQQRFSDPQGGNYSSNTTGVGITWRF